MAGAREQSRAGACRQTLTGLAGHPPANRCRTTALFDAVSMEITLSAASTQDGHHRG